MADGFNEFQERWQGIMPGLSRDELSYYLSHTSPDHPSDNMVWLYDQLLMEIARRGSAE